LSFVKLEWRQSTVRRATRERNSNVVHFQRFKNAPNIT
jgi:hypothetical protein